MSCRKSTNKKAPKGSRSNADDSETQDCCRPQDEDTIALLQLAQFGTVSFSYQLALQCWLMIGPQVHVRTHVRGM